MGTRRSIGSSSGSGMGSEAALSESVSILSLSQPIAAPSTRTLVKFFHFGLVMVKHLCPAQFQGGREHMIVDGPRLMREPHPVYFCIAGKFPYLVGNPLQENFFEFLVMRQLAPVRVKIILHRDILPVTRIQNDQGTQI